MTAPTSARLTEPELVEISGGLTTPRRQLNALRAAGFWRARLGADGRVVLERPHYEAVCAGALQPGSEGPHNAATAARRPQLQRVK